MDLECVNIAKQSRRRMMCIFSSPRSIHQTRWCNFLRRLTIIVKILVLIANFALVITTRIDDIANQELHWRHITRCVIKAREHVYHMYWSVITLSSNPTTSCLPFLFDVTRNKADLSILYEGWKQWRGRDWQTSPAGYCWMLINDLCRVGQRVHLQRYKGRLRRMKSTSVPRLQSGSDPSQRLCYVHRIHDKSS